MSKADDLVGELKKLTQGTDWADVGIAQQLAVFGELLVPGEELGQGTEDDRMAYNGNCRW